MSNRKVSCLSHLLIFVLLSFSASGVASQQQIAEHQVSVAYRLGKVEILKAGSNQWEFLTAGTILSADDLIRMPPRSVLRLRAGALLPSLAEAHEEKVAALIQEAKSIPSDAKKLPSNLGTPAKTDIPTGSEGVRRQTSLSKARQQTAPPITVADLQMLHSMLCNPNTEETAQYYTQDIPPETKTYPYSNLRKARELYNLLRKIQPMETKTALLQNPKTTWTTKRGTETDVAMLYCSLLIGAGVNADLKITEDGTLLVIFDSGISVGKEKRITINEKLIYHIDESDHVWIPLRVNIPPKDYLVAWYLGAKLTREVLNE